MSKLDDALKNRGVSTPHTPAPPQQNTAVADPFASLKTAPVNVQAAQSSAPPSSPPPIVLQTKPQQPTDTLDIGAMEINISAAVDKWPQESQQVVGNEELAQELKGYLQRIADTLNSNEVVGAMEDTWKFIKANPATKDLILPTEIQLMTKALQLSYGVVLAQKTERSSNKSARAQKVTETADFLGDLGF